MLINIHYHVEQILKFIKQFSILLKISRNYLIHIFFLCILGLKLIYIDLSYTYNIKPFFERRVVDE
ncbi:MAG: hypothetical protein A2W74_03130 [Planctomycetes bacterium RIFCSPLOWO2_12_38_17]|nr:MAG: hypothetical protein A2W74_03130 [Planctomycetes bacterium RIFCSPLOWO2_12_38_17]